MSNINLDKIKFKKKFLGIDEVDVWKKIRQLNQEYQAIIEHQKNMYENEIQKKNELIDLLRKKMQ